MLSQPSRFLSGRIAAASTYGRAAPVCVSVLARHTSSTSTTSSPAVQIEATAKEALYYESLPITFSDLKKQNKLSYEIERNIPDGFLTPLQAATFHHAIEHRNLFAHSESRTGRSLAYLVPTLQRLLNKPPKTQTASIVIIVPTRELAFKVAEDAEELLFKTPYKVQTLVGGRSERYEQKQLAFERHEVLVATPGRFVGHLRKSQLKQILSGVRVLVIDEADSLLDPSFEAHVKEINAALPQAKRQTLFFASSVNEDIKKAALGLSRHRLKFISTAEREDPIHSKVEQQHVTVALEDVYPTLLQKIEEFQSENEGLHTRIIVYTPTAAMTEATFRWLQALKPTAAIPVFRVHSHMERQQRMTVALQFAQTPSAILVSSDLTTRGGIDFEYVDLVLQLGMSSSPTQYSLRVAQAGYGEDSEGRSVLILAPYEEPFLALPEIAALPLKKIAPTRNAVLAQWRKRAHAGMEAVGRRVKMDAYKSWLGYYREHQSLLAWNPERLVETANAYAATVLQYLQKNVKRQHTTPPLAVATVDKLGLRGVEGLHVTNSTARHRVRQPQLLPPPAGSVEAEATI